MIARHSIPLTLLAAFAAAVIALPSTDDEIEVLGDPVAAQLRAAGYRYALHSELLRRAHSRAVALEAAARQLPRGGAVVVYTPSGIPALLDQRVRDRAREQYARLPRRDTTVGVIVAIVLDLDVDNIVAGVPVQRAGGLASLDVFPPGAIAANSCVVVMRTHNPSLLRPRRAREHREPLPGDVIGACQWYAAYGVPGAGVAAWLDSTSHSAIRGPSRLPLTRLRTRGMSSEVGPADIMRMGVGPAVSSLYACSGGNMRVCSDMLLAAPRSWEMPHQSFEVNTPGLITDGRGWRAGNNALAPGILVRLERQLGAAAFAKIWSSNQTLPETIESVRGEPMDQWIRKQVQPGTIPYRPGPLPAAELLFVYTSLLALMIWAGVRAVARRGIFS